MCFTFYLSLAKNSHVVVAAVVGHGVYCTDAERQYAYSQAYINGGEVRGMFPDGSPVTFFFVFNISVGGRALPFDLS